MLTRKEVDGFKRGSWTPSDSEFQDALTTLERAVELLRQMFEHHKDCDGVICSETRQFLTEYDGGKRG